ncbi:Extended synaptotagmin-2 [Plecturocebus cupreus]
MVRVLLPKEEPRPRRGDLTLECVFRWLFRLLTWLHHAEAEAPGTCGVPREGDARCLWVLFRRRSLKPSLGRALAAAPWSLRLTHPSASAASCTRLLLFAAAGMYSAAEEGLHSLCTPRSQDRGVLRIHFIEAQDLQGKDTYLKGLVKGKSDPYGIIRVGNQIFQSKVIKENLSPKWNEVYEALVYEHPGQELEIELFDEDPDKDDFLGSLMIDLIEVEKERLLDEWFTLDEVPKGKLHLRLEWLTLMPNASNLDKVLTDIRADKDQANDGLSSALLILYLDSARNLPSGKKISSNPNPLVQMSVGHKAQESKIRYKTNEPVWEENFTFFIHNPKRQDLEVEVRDEQHQCSLGNLKIPLSQLLTSEDMTLSQRFQLSNSGPNSTIKMKIALRVWCCPAGNTVGVGEQGWQARGPWA